MVKLQAVGDRVFVRLDKKTQSENVGLILPDNEVNEHNSGVVISVGSDVTLVKVGDHVLFHIFDDLPIPQEDVVAVRECSLLGVWED